MNILSVSDLRVGYKVNGRVVQAVDGVSFGVARGETIGLVGESGCGKSSLGKAIMQFVDASNGEILFNGRDVRAASIAEGRSLRRQMQFIFQDPYASLNPRQRVGAILEAPLIVHGIGPATERARILANIVDQVSLPRDVLTRYPHELSGGQRQRVGIARALILEPQLLICDEPVSALDVSIQAQILNLLADLREKRSLSFVFISHDLSVIRFISHRVLVMYLGRIVESAPTEALWKKPAHPYTRALIASVPDAAKPRSAAAIEGDLPSPFDIPSGCRFRMRCPLATEICGRVDPALEPRPGDRSVACHHADVN